MFPQKNKLDAQAQGSIYLDLAAQRVAGAEPMTVNIETMDALTGEVNIVARQTKDANGQALSARYIFADRNMQVGTNAVFQSSGTLNSVDASSDFSGTGFLDVVTGGYVNWKTLSGNLNVKRAVSETDSVKLSVDGARETTLLAGAMISAATEVTIEANGDVNFDQSATLFARDKISIRGDLGSNYSSSVINWNGQATAKEVLIAGGNHDNTINIRQTQSNTATTVLMGNGNDVVNVGSSANTLTSIQGKLDIVGANDNSQDTLNVNASGSSASLSGKLTGATIAGLGTAAGIYYNGIESLTLTLGDRDDDIALLSTRADTTIEGNGGDDHFRVGAELNGAGSASSEEVNGNIVSATDISGINHVTTIRGGAGSDRFTINRNIAALKVEGNEGDDTLIVNTPVENSQMLLNGNVDFKGGFGQDEVIVHTSGVASVSRPDSSTIKVQDSRLITIDSTVELAPSATTPNNPPTEPTDNPVDSLSLLSSFLNGLSTTSGGSGSSTGSGSTGENGSTGGGNGSSSTSGENSASESLLNNFLNSLFSFF